MTPNPSATPLEASPGAIETRKVLLRDFIAEHASLAGIQVQHVQLYAEVGDDAGLAYAVATLGLYTKATVQAFNDLSRLNELTKFKEAAE
jgi:hypothetical protein